MKHCSEPYIVAAKAADTKKAIDTVIMLMKGLLEVTDVFVITSGANSKQVKAIVEEIEKTVKDITGRKPDFIEGLRDCQWVLIDYGNFVVHVFDEPTRELYDLERLWLDAPRIDFESELVSLDKV
jgi:ribosome-associated protein